MCAIIDAPPGCFEKLSLYLEKNKLTPTKLLLTHSHWDHIGDVAQVKKKFLTPVLIHRDDVGNLEKPGSDRLPCWIEFPPVHPDGFIEDGDNIAVGQLRITVIHTPGHTPGCVCFYNAENHLLFTGDTLFQGSIGNLSFPTAKPELMWDSLEKLRQLPAETRVLPGHGASTTIGSESWLARAQEIFG